MTKSKAEVLGMDREGGAAPLINYKHHGPAYNLRFWLREIREPHGRTPEAQGRNAAVAASLVEELVASLGLTDEEIDFLTERKIVAGETSYWLKTRNPHLYAKLRRQHSTQLSR